MNLHRTILCSLLALPCFALADDGPRYTFVEGGYRYIDFDDFNEDGDGWGLDGALAVNDFIFLFAGYSDIEVDVGFVDVDFTSYSFGGGVNLAVTPTLDVLFDLAYVDVEADAGPVDADDDGYGIGAGIRWMVLEQLELNGGIEYTDLDESGDDTALALGGVFNFTDNFAVGATGTFGDDTTGAAIDLRYYFGDFQLVQ